MPQDGEYINIAEDITEDDARYPLKNTYVYPGGTLPTEIDYSHYGLSLLRARAIAAAKDSGHFSSAQQELMNATTVTTTDTRNTDSAGKNLTYTTTDKLYAPATDKDECTYIKVGSNNQVVIDIESCTKYYGSQFQYWTRTARAEKSVYIFPYLSPAKTSFSFSNEVIYFLPVSNLNLSNVLFASSAKAATSNTESGAVSGTIADDTAMSLRLDGTGKNIGVAIYDAKNGQIEVRKGTTSQTVSLVVQGKGMVGEEEKDWYYSKKIDEPGNISASEIKSVLSLSSDIDLSACKIWLEITDTDEMIYAVCADKKIEPINTAYVTRVQLMNSFKPYSDGTAANIGKLVFGKNSSGTSQEWYILGKDEGVSGENTIIFAASPIATSKVFNSSDSNKSFASSFGVYVSNPSEVYPNHYGASELRAALQEMAKKTSYFTTAEQGLMNATTVITKDTKNSNVTYTTTDKLYALQGDYNNDEYLWAGSSDSTVLAISSYWSNSSSFWLRSPYDRIGVHALLAFPGICVSGGYVCGGSAVQPASNLNLSSVLFASAATAASSDTVESYTIASGTAMTLRLNGTGKNIGAAIYNAETGIIEVRKGTTSKTVALVVQGNDGTNNWYYSKKIDESGNISASDIKSALNLSEDIDLSTCKIWLEITDTDGLIYAVCADKEIEPINTTYVTREQLMNSFKPYSNGTAVNKGKVVFGKKSDGTTAQEWYILGKDSCVSGDNTIILAASPIATYKAFDINTNNKNFESRFGVYASAPTDVFANHYGSSELRAALQEMETSCFTTAEQGLMNATTVTTQDTKNSVTYTTTDKLYALAADGYGPSCTTIKAGTSDSTVLDLSYLSDGLSFWLRSPFVQSNDYALAAKPGKNVFGCGVRSGEDVRPASNLNLSSVLFASSAKAASSDTAVSGTIASETAMTLRLDGSDTAIGMAHYDAAKGVIVADRAANAAGTVSLVVQGNDGTNDWYYSVPLGETTVVFASQIKDSITSLSTVPDLADCNIWLETTIDNVAYVLFSTLNDAPFFTLNGTVSA